MNYFDDLTKQMDEAFTYKPLTDEEYQISCVNDIQEWAEAISGEWNGKTEAGEDRAHCADEIIEKLEQLKILIQEMGEL